MLFLVIFVLVMFVVIVVKNSNSNTLMRVTKAKVVNKVNTVLGHVGMDTSKAIDVITDDDDLSNEQIDELLYSNDYAVGSNYTPKAVKFDAHSTIHGNYTYDFLLPIDNDPMLDMHAAMHKADEPGYDYYKHEHARKNYSRIHKYNKINRAACRSPYKQYDEEYLVEA